MTTSVSSTVASDTTIALDGNSTYDGNTTVTALQLSCIIGRDTQFIIGISITSLGIIGNIAFMFVVGRIQSMRTMTNSYLVNLALADLLHSVVHSLIWNCIFFGGDVCFLHEWQMYCGVMFPSRVSQYVSMFTVTILSIERYLALCKPIIYRGGYIHKRSFVATVIALTWIASIMISTEGLVDCLNSKTRSIAGRFIYLLTVFILLIVVVIFYLLIIIRVRRSRNSVKKNEFQIIRVCFAAAIVYFVCTMPAVLQAFILLLQDLNSFTLSDDLIMCLTNASTFLLEINSSANPVVYNALSSLYRKAFMDAFNCRNQKCCPGSSHYGRNSPTNTEMTSYNQIKTNKNN
ncbi:neuropeptides capa receptor-like [Saccoglossus kowalevskii]|uniref:Delta-type opioid receptor-like n=1 Tax=Saccoglossus kowalevskii TaxID=10224 RepID=A0ABM0MRT4_SACKO|nr:PREDICTED: delta-type opioid receptor-like [Saccoglossus kowalevskii]